MTLPVAGGALNPRNVLALGSLAIAVFGVLCVRHAVPVIEEDITERVSEALADARIRWANLEVRGRDVVLTGIAPDASTWRVSALALSKECSTAVGQTSASPTSAMRRWLSSRDR